MNQETSGGLHNVEIRVPNPDRDDWDDLLEAHVEVFCYLVLRGQRGASGVDRAAGPWFH